MNLSTAKPQVDMAAMASTGLKVSFNILDKWGCTGEQIQQIFQISRSAYYRYRETPSAAKLSRDQIARISYILNIHSALRTVFDNPDNVYGFMSMKNNNAFFNGETPLNLISSGDYASLYEVARRVVALRGGSW